jgi:hypothetical protein
MPRKQRFKPSRKPKPISENASASGDLTAVTIGHSVPSDQNHASQPALQPGLHEEDA